MYTVFSSTHSFTILEREREREREREVLANQTQHGDGFGTSQVIKLHTLTDNWPWLEASMVLTS